MSRDMTLWAVYETRQDADRGSLETTFSSNALSIFLCPDVSGRSKR